MFPAHKVTNREVPMKKLMFAMVIAFAVVGGAVAVSTMNQPAVAEPCSNPNC
jgi:hypothetical protein